MERYDFDIPVSFKHRVVFTRNAFKLSNSSLRELLEEGQGRRAIVVLEKSVARSWEELSDEILKYFLSIEIDFLGIRLYEGGELCKADDSLVKEIWKEIDLGHIDRHSYLIVIGGGAFLDAVGFAASTAHRGIRLVRFPTTTLSQDDSGVGVKNAINAFHKKNWIGSFSVPYAVVNDFTFLESQDPETSRYGLIEAIKVALVKDAEFFEWIERNVESLAVLEQGSLEECVKRSALHHARHIAGSGDAFETGSSRPLDFGHWAAHKLEALTNYELTHARAVAIGIAIDTIYAQKMGFLPAGEKDRILLLLGNLNLDVYHPALNVRDAKNQRRVIAGLDEFREHLGGRLTVLQLSAIGRGIDVHEFDMEVLEQSITELELVWEQSLAI